MTKSAANFRNQLSRLLAEGAALGFVAVEVNAGRLHRLVGDYPGAGHRMPVCCGAMRRAMAPGDEVVFQPPRGKGARLTIRYRLPRPK